MTMKGLLSCLIREVYGCEMAGQSIPAADIGEHSVCLLCVGCITSLSCTVLLPHGEEKEK